MVMEQIRIIGGRRLFGSVRLQGSKNGVLPVLAAAVLTEGISVIHNCPDLEDVAATVEILKYLGCGVRRENETLIVDSYTLEKHTIPCEMMQKLRSSIIFMGALLARCGKAEICSPGGCELGPRPIDLHIWGLRSLGARITDRDGTLVCEAQNKKGKEIILSIPSVGATENLMLYATACRGETVIINAAREPEIAGLQDYLNAAGFKVSGAGSPVVRIEGEPTLRRSPYITYTVIPDRIAAATWLCAVAAAGGELEIKNAEPAHLASVTDCLREAGCLLEIGGDYIKAAMPARPRALGRMVRTGPYPCFPTDVQPLLCVPMAIADGSTIFEENIFDGRFRHAAELNKMGAKITVSGKYAICTGVESLSGTAVTACDLRGGAALTIAGLCAAGETIIRNPQHIDRGYHKIEETLSALGADIRRESE